MEWISTDQKLPNFGERVLVYCWIYGTFIASYEQIGGTNHGQWSDGGKLGILKPKYWRPLPPPPE